MSAFRLLPLWAALALPFATAERLEPTPAPYPGLHMLVEQDFTPDRDDPPTSTSTRIFNRDGRLLSTERRDRYSLVDFREDYTYDTRGCVTELRTQDGLRDDQVVVTQYRVKANCDVVSSTTVDAEGQEVSQSAFSYSGSRETGEMRQKGQVVRRLSSQLNAQGRVTERTVRDAQGALVLREHLTYHPNGRTALKTQLLKSGPGWAFLEMVANPQGDVRLYRGGALPRDVDPASVVWKDLVKLSGPACFQEEFDPGDLDAQGRWTITRQYRVNNCGGTGYRDLRKEIRRSFS